MFIALMFCEISLIIVSHLHSQLRKPIGGNSVLVALITCLSVCEGLTAVLVVCARIVQIILRACAFCTHTYIYSVLMAGVRDPGRLLRRVAKHGK